MCPRQPIWAASRRRWAAIPDDAELPADLPVLVVADRDQVAPILGFRHITGIAPWEPYPQALKIVREYFTGKGQAALEKFFWKNSIAAYRWVKRDASQPA